MTTTAAPTAPRRLNRRELTAALSAIDTQINGLRSVIATYEATFTSLDEIPSPVYDAWTTALSALDSLRYRRNTVEANPHAAR